MSKAVLATLIYADIFDFPLSHEEIWQGLIKENSKGKWQKAKLKKNLLFLVKKGLVEEKQGFYYLAGRGQIVEIRKKRAVFSKQKRKVAENIAEILRKIPWLKLIGLTGGVASNNAQENDDIDLFFIVGEKRLWLTRGLVVLILSCLGVYRRPLKVKDMICPNMFVAEDHLRMRPYDLFLAHEICGLKPLWEKDNFYQKFRQANRWTNDFLPHLTERKRLIRQKVTREFFLASWFFDVLETLARSLQLWHMQKKKTTEITTGNLIKFHPLDVRQIVLKKYQEKLAEFYPLDKIQRILLE